MVGAAQIWHYTDCQEVAHLPTSARHILAAVAAPPYNSNREPVWTRTCRRIVSMVSMTLCSSQRAQGDLPQLIQARFDSILFVIPLLFHCIVADILPACSLYCASSAMHIIARAWLTQPSLNGLGLACCQRSAWSARSGHASRNSQRLHCPWQR